MSRTTVLIPTRVLVLGMVGEDGTIRAAEVYPVAEACGQTADQVRSCLRRLVDEGAFTRAGTGRDAVFQATEAGLGRLGVTIERTRLAYAQDAAGRGWDRHWHLVAFAVPERNRSLRDTLRDRLLEFGGAPVHGALYVSPHQWHKDVRAVADRLGVGVTLASTDDLEIAGERDPRELARRLWDLDDLAQRYESFVESHRFMLAGLDELKRQHRRLPDAAFLPGALAMAVAFAAVFNDDPLLPPELLPRPWPGRNARDLLVRSRRLALGLRQTPGRPALFRTFDDAIDAIA